MDDADDALLTLRAAVEQARQDLDHVLSRAAVLQAGRSEGRAYSDLVADAHRPLVVELISDVLARLSGAGAEFRRAEARALHADGLSHEAIAGLFGVSRQRVGALLSHR